MGGLSLGGIKSYGVTEAIRIPELAIGVIVAGVILMLLSIVGMIGTVKELKSLLVIFVILLLLISIVELGLGITAYTLADKATIQTQIAKVWPKFSNAVHKLVQNNFVCCGLHGVPDTKEACPTLGVGHPCLIPFSSWVSSKIEILDIIAVISAIVQIVIVVFAILLVRAASLRREIDTVPLLSSNRIVIVS